MTFPLRCFLEDRYACKVLFFRVFVKGGVEAVSWGFGDVSVVEGNFILVLQPLDS